MMMTKSFKWLVLVLPLLFAACGEEDLDNVLFYDGTNVSGPVLPAGTHEFAVRFTPDQLAEHIGKKLVEISFFVGAAPDNGMQVVVYGPGTSERPGAELYVANIDGVILQERNTHLVISAVPLEITGDDIWISLRVTQTSAQQSIGCDAGPNEPNGDWLYRSDDQQWIPFSERTGESVNWNIRGFVE
ncbi:MAG: hypothetical protein AAF738_03225 [Bacteroidota bacterium]